MWRTDGLELAGADDRVAGIVFAGPHRVDRLVVGGDEVVRDGTLVSTSHPLLREIVQAGIPADVVVDLIRMFSYKVDFQRDLHPGDKFEV